MELSDFELFMINSSLEKFFRSNYKELSLFALERLSNEAIDKHPSELEAIVFREENMTLDFFFNESTNTSYFRKIVEEWREFENRKNIEFLAAVESCKHLLIERKSIIPQKEFWSDFYYSWFLRKQEMDPSKVSIYDLQKINKNTPSDIIDWLSEISEFGSEKVWTSGKIEIIAHHLKVLQVVGVLDLIDEMFSYKHYDEKKTRRETDKASFIALIMGIPEQQEQVRQRLKRRHELETGPSLETAKKIFTDHGLLKFFEAKEKKY
jgi:hypothetical protein